MNSDLDFPSSPECCITHLEANFFLVRDSHRFLKRPPIAIQRHLAQCDACQHVISTAWKGLRDDQNRVREVLGAPKLPSVEGILPPICFERFDTPSKTNLESSVESGSVSFANRDIHLSQDDLRDVETEFDSELEHRFEGDTPADKQEPAHPQFNVSRTYAEEQLARNVMQKKLVARWVAEEIPLRKESSILIDAGSQGYYVWKEISSRLKDAQRSNLTVLTFNHSVIESWFRNEDNAQSFAPNFQLAGNHCNAFHGSVLGADPDRLASYHPDVALIGTNGLRVDAGRIYVGFNCGDEELEDKKLLFRLGVTQRVVMLTSAKIGDSGGRAFDLLDLPDLDVDAPIYFVTDEATQGSVPSEALKRALENMESEKMRSKLLQRGISINWVIVSNRNGFRFELKEFGK